MAKLALNKSELNRQKKQLNTYERFLPALELKQQQLMAEKKKAELALAKTRRQLEENHKRVAQQLPMLACEDIHLRGMVRVENLTFAEDYIVGVAVPSLGDIDIKVIDYGFLSKPHWIDPLVAMLEEAIRLKVEVQIQERRLHIVKEATRSATQRVNLFSKILIPETRQAIRKIKVFLSDMETAAVVRSKMTKQKAANQEQTAAMQGG